MEQQIKILTLLHKLMLDAEDISEEAYGVEFTPEMKKRIEREFESFDPILREMRERLRMEPMK